MSIFPANPQINDEFSGKRWNGTAWEVIGIDLSRDYILQNELDSHTSASTAVHGISNVGNLATKAYADNSASAAAAAVVDAAPGALNTLNELAAALNDDANFATTITNSLSTKLDSSTASSTYAPISTTVTLTGSQTLTNKTFTSPNIDYGLMRSPEEIVTVSASSATGTINFNLLTHGVLYYTSNSGANFTLNFRGDASNTLNNILSNGQSITALFLNTNGATAYYPTAFQIDGGSVTPKWSGGSAPTSGNANSIDAYSFSIIKTANATFTVLAGAARFA